MTARINLACGHGTQHPSVAGVELLLEWDGPAVLPPCQYRMLAGGTEDKEHAMSQKLDTSFVPGHHGPGHPGEFVGERDGGDLGGSPIASRKEAALSAQTACSAL